MLGTRKVSNQILKILRLNFSNSQYVFTGCPSNKYFSLEEKPEFVNTKINKPELVKLISDVIYLWLYLHWQNKSMDYQKLWFESIKDDTLLTVHVEYEEKYTQSSCQNLIHFLTQIFNSLTRNFKGEFGIQRKQGSTQKANIQMDDMISNFFLRVKQLKENKDDADVMVLIKQLQNTFLLKQKCLLVKTYNRSLFKRIAQTFKFMSQNCDQKVFVKSGPIKLQSGKQKLYDSSSSSYSTAGEKPRETLELDIENKEYLRSLISVEKELQKIGNRRIRIENVLNYRVFCNKNNIKAVINQNISSRSQLYNFQLYEMVSLLKKYFEILNKTQVIKYEEMKLQENQAFCGCISFHEIPDILFMIIISNDKQILVKLQTNTKVFLQERDLRIHWMNLLKFQDISLGSRVGIPFKSQRLKTPAVRDTFVILYGSDMFYNQSLFIKVCILIDSLMVANSLLQPGLKEYKLSETIVKDQCYMRKQMTFMHSLFQLNYENLKLRMNLFG